MKKYIAVITGGSSGLGKEMAISLRLRGLSVCVLARGRERLKETVDMLALLEAPGNPSIYSFVGDVSVWEDCVNLSLFLAKQDLSVKWLINNAGEACFGKLPTLSEHEILTTVYSNLHGVIFMSRHFVEDLVENNGVLCNIMSTAAHTSRINETVYCAAKWGARGFNDALKVEYKEKSVKIMAVYPGGMNTSFWKKIPQVSPHKFMDPRNVASTIIHNMLDSGDCEVNEMIINRPRVIK